MDKNYDIFGDQQPSQNQSKSEPIQFSNEPSKPMSLFKKTLLGVFVGFFGLIVLGSAIPTTKVSSDKEATPTQVMGVQSTSKTPALAPSSDPTSAPSIAPSPSATPTPVPTPTPKPSVTPKPTIKPSATVAPQAPEADAGCGTYVNTAGNTVARPCDAPTKPANATAQCKDGTYSFSQSKRGTCSGHGGVATWY